MEKLIVLKKEFEIISTLSEDEYHKSYHVKRGDKHFFIKKFSDYPSFKASLENRKALKKNGINIPKILKSSKKELVIITQYIEGKNCLELIADSELNDNIYEQLFHIYRFARFAKIELNYLPENYVFYKGDLYYLSEHFEPQNKNKNLENYGIYFWFYGNECVEHLKEKELPIDKSRILQKGEVNKKIVLTSIMKW